MEYSRVTRQQRGELRGCPAGSIRPADIEEPRQRAVHEHCRRLGDRQHRTAIGSGGNSHLYARILHLLTRREACPREPDDLLSTGARTRKPSASARRACAHPEAEGRRSQSAAQDFACDPIRARTSIGISSGVRVCLSVINRGLSIASPIAWLQYVVGKR